jgi:hypothetical protein
LKLDYENQRSSALQTAESIEINQDNYPEKIRELIQELEEMDAEREKTLDRLEEF